MSIKKRKVNTDEVMKYLEERFETADKIENEIRASSEYICWLRDILKENGQVNDYDIQYREIELEKETYENFCKLEYFYNIIVRYWKKNKILPTYIEKNFGVPVYRVFYEDFYFEICKIPYLEGYVSVCKTRKSKNSINYIDIMKDKYL